VTEKRQVHVPVCAIFLIMVDLRVHGRVAVRHLLLKVKPMLDRVDFPCLPADS